MGKFFMWLQFALLMVMMLMLLRLAWQNRRLKKQQDLLVDDLRGQRYWRINLAQEAYYKKWLRILPFEAKGVLIDDGDAFVIKGYWLSKKAAFVSRFKKSDCRPQWLGNRSLRSSNLYWARLHTARGTLLFTADTGVVVLSSREALADIFRSAFPDYPLDQEQTREFALEKNPRSLSLLIGLLGLVVAGLLNQFFVSHWLELTDDQLGRILRYPLTMPVALLCALAVASALYVYLTRGRVPARESMVLSMFMSVALLATVIPAAKRIDQLLAPPQAQNYAYKVKEFGVLVPVDSKLGLPQLRFPRTRDYWAQFPKDSIYQVPFVHGPLGLWQLDHSQFDVPLRQFYEKQEGKKPTQQRANPPVRPAPAQT